ncbi:MAG: DMT family transporter [Neisseria sp.]|nr:DMT family transporter [Neisseria sp.]MDO4640272.1 DMT family transporter [Neisseria sp.]
MVLSVTGALIAISHGHPIQLFAGGVGKGEYLLLCTVLCWTGYTLLGRMVLKDISPLLTTTITAFFGAWFLFAAALFYEGTQAWTIALQAPISVWLCLLAMGLGATALTYLWFFAGVHALGVGTASAYIALVPVVGILIAALWLGEALDFSLLFGGALAVSGTLLMNLAKL